LCRPSSAFTGLIDIERSAGLQACQTGGPKGPHYGQF
jgi:hypothetical protein